MPAAAVELRPTIDRAWLEAEAHREPVLHAYALWDLRTAPDRIRVVSAVAGDRTIGYLLVWLGHPAGPVVHWVGSDPETEPLAEALPPRPMVAIVPEEFRDAPTRSRGPVRDFPISAMVAPALFAERGWPAPDGVRPLVRADRPALLRWIAGVDDPVVGEYAYLDPDADRIWGAFAAGELVGVARAAVRLPEIWVLGGVFVSPDARGHGWGRSLVRTVMRAAAEAGAPLALYVREDREPARRLYESLGFRPVARRTWLDAGAGLAP